MIALNEPSPGFAGGARRFGGRPEIELIGYFCRYWPQLNRQIQISLYISVFAGNLDSETSSLLTRSSTGESYANSIFWSIVGAERALRDALPLLFFDTPKL